MISVSTPGSALTILRASIWAPDWAKALFRHITPDNISQQELINRMNEIEKRLNEIQAQAPRK